MADGLPPKKSWLYVLPLLLLLLALVPRLLLLFALPPGSDVYYVDGEAARVLLTGQNPYDHSFTTIPSPLATPGAVHAFAYLPFTAIYLVPSYLLGDIRSGLILADLFIGYCIYSMGGRRNTLASAVYLFLPFTMLLSTVYVNNLLIGLVFLSLFFLMEKREDGYGHRGRAGALSLGVALATSLLIWLVFPFVAYRYVRSGRWMLALLCPVVALFIAVPFVIATGPSAFVYETLTFQFSRPILPLISYSGPAGYNLNLALTALALSLFHIEVPGALRVALVLLALPVCLRRCASLEGVMLQTSLFATFALFVLPNNLFWAYAELPLMTFLILIAFRRNPNSY